MNWQEVLEDKSLQDLPYKIELNRWGQIVMSPARNKQSCFQNEILFLLKRLKLKGRVLPECAIHTSDNVKVADAVWLSLDRYKRVKHEDVYSVAPEICVEILSPSNTKVAMAVKKELYFERGALEFWLCDDNGAVTFFGTTGKLAKSQLVPKFPARIEV